MCHECMCNTHVHTQLKVKKKGGGGDGGSGDGSMPRQNGHKQLGPLHAIEFLSQGEVTGGGT